MNSLKLTRWAYYPLLVSLIWALGFTLLPGCERFSISFIDTLEQIIGGTLPAIINNPFKNTPAHVRYGSALAPQEIAYLQQRKKYVKAAIQKNIGINFVTAKMPTVALLCSGGGYRAMLYATGVLKALEQRGMLDIFSYVIGLSGSTWALAPWISSGQSPTNFHDWLINALGVSMHVPTDHALSLIENVLVTKYCLGKKIGFEDIFGACLADNLFAFFTQNQDEVFLSQQAAAVASGAQPLPIYTSINAMTQQTENLWFEFTPFEVGAPWLGVYIPTWAFGRKCKTGVSVYNDPEETLATLMGTFGLAVGLSVADAFSLLNISAQMKSVLAQKILDDILNEIGNDRFITADYWNFGLGISKPVLDQPYLELVDAGINCNIPYAPVSGQTSGRKADILVIADASAGTVGQELRKVALYAQINKLPFPTIDYTNIEKNAVSVFQDSQNLDAPVVIYIPRIVDSALVEQYKTVYPDLYNLIHDFDIEASIAHGVSNTYNFVYSCIDARRITALAEFNTIMAQAALVKAITDFNL